MIECSFIWKIILHLILFECFDLKGIQFCILRPRNFFPCNTCMSCGRPSSLSLIKTKNERGSRKKVPCYFKVTYFIKNSGVRKNPAA